MHVLLASAQDQNDSIDGKYEIIPTRIGKLCISRYSLFVSLRAWYLLQKPLISLSNELGMVSTLILFFLKGFSMVSTKLFFEKA
jgi:hypothetical protein